MVPTLVCIFLRLSTTVHWAATPCPARDSESGSRAPRMDLFFHGLRACSDSSRHKHLCGLGQGCLSTPPTPPQEVFELNYGGEGMYREKGSEGPPNRSFGLVPSPAYTKLWVWVQWSDKQVGTFTREWRLRTRPGLPGVAAVTQSFFPVLPWLL